MMVWRPWHRKPPELDRDLRVRLHRVATFVEPLWEQIALPPREIAKRLGIYEGSARADLSYLVTIGVIRAIAPPAKAGRRGQHDYRYCGLS